MNPKPVTEHLKNTQFQPGESGNPSGKPKGTKNFTTLVRDMLKRVAVLKEGNPNNLTYEDVLADQVIKRAIQGNDRVLKILWEQMDGRPRQQIDLSAELGDDSRQSIADLTELFRGMAKKP